MQLKAAKKFNKKLEYLQAGDTVDIIAPGSRCKVEILEKVKQLLATWGLQCNISPAIFGEDLHCANSAAERLQQLKQALSNQTSKAIWCLRGGYGSAKLIPFLNKIKPVKQTKFFIGFSDVTVLHLFLEQNWGWSTLHAPSAKQVALNEVSLESIDTLKRLLFGTINILSYKLTPLNSPAKINHILKASVTGGNLSLIQTSIGTAWQIDTTDKILLLEDVNERAYRVDRMLEHLEQAGIFKKAKAILLGDFTGGEEPDGKSLMQETLKNFAEYYKIPVLGMSGGR